MQNEIRKFVNNTGIDFGVFWEPIIQAINLDGQMPEVGQVEFYVDGKKTDLIGVQNEINKLHDEKVAKKELTHKKIFVGDGVTHLRKKAVWIRR